MVAGAGGRGVGVRYMTMEGHGVSCSGDNIFYDELRFNKRQKRDFEEQKSVGRVHLVRGWTGKALGAPGAGNVLQLDLVMGR